MAGRLPEEVLLVGAVEVDVSGSCVGVLGVETIEPEDPGLHVIRWILGGADPSCGFATDKDLAQRRRVAMFFRDDESSRGRAVAAG